MTDNGTLAGFEERRLAELQAYIAAKPRKRPRGRLYLALAAVVGLGAVTAGVLVASSGREAAYGVGEGDDGTVVITVRDSARSVGNMADLTEQLRALGIPAIVDFEPEGKMCKEPRGVYVEDIPKGLYTVPYNDPGVTDGFQMKVNPKLFRKGETWVWTLAPQGTTTHLYKDPVAPCELVPDTRPEPKVVEQADATKKGEPLEGVPVERQKAATVVAEIEKRGLKVHLEVLEPYPGNPGGGGIDPENQGPVGPGWVAWSAVTQKDEPGVIRLTVTEQAWENNPLCGGPCP
ncbi:hypothetical protein ACIBG8_53420 [Nonomuraea sp. NPDC050556]|uniref:hypothetical protein n=1 Tax=Nonomuraea sp. NPDC050556 TaxID=3364369 RepID=UPI0037AC83DC